MKRRSSVRMSSAITMTMFGLVPAAAAVVTLWLRGSRTGALVPVSTRPENRATTRTPSSGTTALGRAPKPDSHLVTCVSPREKSGRPVARVSAFLVTRSSGTTDESLVDQLDLMPARHGTGRDGSRGPAGRVLLGGLV